MKDPIFRAIDLAQIGFEYGGPFGAVVTRERQIIGEGFNVVVAHRDPTAHAEVMAIRAACRALKTHDLTGCELHTSCEPCPMCLGAIYWARIGKVYYAATRDDAAAAGFDDDDIYIELARPVDERRIQFIQALEATRVAARAVLEAWKTKPDRRHY